jgi:diadenosine tetraphosphate (Ap4A) HIT family hydrolase
MITDAAPFIAHETRHWLVNHHSASALPGYLMLGARTPVDSLARLPAEALAELGGLVARTQQIIVQQLQPKWLYISRYGHVPGHPFHFHFIPVYPWVEALFWRDERYCALQDFASTENAMSLTDGAELTLFVWREFGERPVPPPVEGPAIIEVIERLRAAFS